MMHTRARIVAATLAGLCWFTAGCGENPVATNSGLSYVDLTPGTGSVAKSGDFVEIHAIGRLQVDDTCFENSHEAKKSYLIRLGSGEKIKGLEEGIAGMKAGGKRKLYIPFALGFGDENRGVLCPPRSDLVYEVELLRVVDGFKIEELSEGTGPPAKWLDQVQISYTGTLKDGSQQFDGYRDKDPLPYVFQIGGPDARVARGWSDGIVGMKKGGRRKITIPAELGFGKLNPKGRIPADADTVFEIELVEILDSWPGPR